MWIISTVGANASSDAQRFQNMKTKLKIDSWLPALPIVSK